MKLKRTIFNVLDHIPTITAGSGSAVSSDSPIATAAFYNNDVGICPKCKSPMGTATIANDDTVFFCTKDRVALPTPNAAV